MKLFTVVAEYKGELILARRINCYTKGQAKELAIKEWSKTNIGKFLRYVEISVVEGEGNLS